MKSKQSEHAHQVTLVNWFDREYPEFEGILFAIPNGGLRAKRVAEQLKREGLRKGVPDMMLPVPKGEYAGLFIELKAEGGRPTKEQKVWVPRLNELGYLAVFSYGWESAAETISDYLKL